MSLEKTEITEEGVKEFINSLNIDALVAAISKALQEQEN